MTEPVAGDLIKKHLELRAFVKAKSDEFAAFIKPYADGMDMIENKLLEMLNDQKSQNFKSEWGTAYKSEIMNVKIENRDAYLAFITQNWQTYGSDMLQVGATKEPIRAYLDAQPEDNRAPPPGIHLTFITKVNVRRS